MARWGGKRQFTMKFLYPGRIACLVVPLVWVIHMLYHFAGVLMKQLRVCYGGGHWKWPRMVCYELNLNLSPPGGLCFEYLVPSEQCCFEKLCNPIEVELTYRNRVLGAALWGWWDLSLDFSLSSASGSPTYKQASATCSHHYGALYIPSPPGFSVPLKLSQSKSSLSLWPLGIWTLRTLLMERWKTCLCPHH